FVSQKLVGRICGMEFRAPPRNSKNAAQGAAALMPLNYRMREKTGTRMLDHKGARMYTKGE
ncbi:MAG: hypothetical protein LBH51_08570, partial [Treponema sp.]|nr:hypothetical protein [Treponema sp.]